MSAELIKARQQLTQIKSLVKQNKPFPATQALQSALATVIRSSLLSSERAEFEDMISSATHSLANNETVRKVFPLSLNYTPGQEREFLETIQQLIETLDSLALEDAEEHLRLLEATKKIALENAQQHLDKKEYLEAEAVFHNLTDQIPGDVDLLCEIGDRYLKAECYDDAFTYLSQAIEIDPSLVHLYNRIGIVLRKLNKLDMAEMYYLKALQYSDKNPYLFFNLGRLYVEWGKWSKAEEIANIILKLAPNFAEAGKLLAFARKKMALEGSKATP
jgi:tetratricopeptide (TPR) repeat protein